MRADDDRPAVAELYVIRAEAGAEQTVLLRRLAWEAATQADVLCLYLREDGLLSYEALREIYRLTQQRMFVFVDGAAKHAQELAYVVADAVSQP